MSKVFDFQKWFIAQFGPKPKRSVHAIYQELDGARHKTAKLEQELEAARIWAYERRAASYAIQAAENPSDKFTKEE